MNRDQILEAAAMIFRQKGFHAASMADIAQAVNLQKASLYHHINSKQDILLELLDKALDIVIEELLVVSASELPPFDKLQMAMIAYMKTLVDHHDITAVLLLEFRSLDPQYLARHVPKRDRFEQIWKDILEEGTQAGVFQCEQVSLAARALLSVMNGIITWYRPDGSLSIEEIAREYSHLFLFGLLTRQV